MQNIYLTKSPTVLSSTKGILVTVIAVKLKSVSLSLKIHP